MQTTKTQAEFDVEKWLKSECAGYDMCGEFDFCTKCDKEIENPCAVAYDSFYATAAPKKPETKKPAAKATTAKAEKTAKPIAEKAVAAKAKTEKAVSTEKKTTTKPKAK